MKLQELRQIIREEISKTLNENQLPSEIENLIKQYRAKDIYNLVDILKNKGTTIAKELNINEYRFEIKNENDRVIYAENSDGYWEETKYDSKGNKIYYENSNRFWYKQEFDSNGNVIYFKNSKGRWYKQEFDSKGKCIYYKNSDGEIIDKRPKPTVELTLEEISKTLNEGVYYLYNVNIQKLIKSYGAKDIYDLIDILKKEQTTLAKRLGVTKFPFEIEDINKNELYYEDGNGLWWYQKYDSKNNPTYDTNHRGHWFNYEYDSSGKVIKYSDHTGKVVDKSK